MPREIDAILTAGGILPPDDPLCRGGRAIKKALLPVANRPMILWIIEAMLEAPSIRDVFVVGLKAEELAIASPSIRYLEAVGDMLDNIEAALKELKTLHPDAEQALICSIDIPAVTPQMVEHFIDACEAHGADFNYAVVERRDMEQQFPGCKRTFVPFRDGRFAGGDIFLLNLTAAGANLELARQLTSARKNYLHQARMIGLEFIVQFLLRRLTLADAVRHVSKVLNINGAAIVTPHAELAMDIDKPHQLQIVEAELLRRSQ